MKVENEKKRGRFHHNFFLMVVVVVGKRQKQKQKQLKISYPLTKLPKNTVKVKAIPPRTPSQLFSEENN